MLLHSLWAVHLNEAYFVDDVSTQALWLGGGFVVAAALAVYGAWGLREDEIGPMAVLTAGFFVASLLHVPLFVTSVHLLLNGLLGVMLGRRAAVAIPVGLALQAFLFSHGGIAALGLNSCIMGIPALLAGALFPWLQRPQWLRRGWFRSGLVAVSALTWLLSLAIVLRLILRSAGEGLTVAGLQDALTWTVQPWLVATALALTGAAVWGELRWKPAPEFPLGLLLGEMTVLLTVALNGMVLVLAVHDTWQTVALLVVVAHLPVAVVEGMVLGFLVGFLAQVKPELLRRPSCDIMHL